MAPPANASPKARRRALGVFCANTSRPPTPVARPAAVVTASATRMLAVEISIMGVLVRCAGCRLGRGAILAEAPVDAARSRLPPARLRYRGRIAPRALHGAGHARPGKTHRAADRRRQRPGIQDRSDPRRARPPR